MTFSAIGEHRPAPDEAIKAEEAAATAFLDVVRASMRQHNAGNPHNEIDFAVNSLGTAVDRLVDVAVENAPGLASPPAFLAFIGHSVCGTVGELLGCITDPAQRLEAIRFAIEGLNRGLSEAQEMAASLDPGRVH